MTPEQLEHLPLYSGMLTELGIGTSSYLQTQDRQSETVGDKTSQGQTWASRGMPAPSLQVESWSCPSGTTHLKYTQIVVRLAL